MLNVLGMRILTCHFVTLFYSLVFLSYLLSQIGVLFCTSVMKERGENIHAFFLF